MSRFRVVDAYNCYILRDLITGREACMGDGVGQFVCLDCDGTGYIVDYPGPDAVTELCGCGGQPEIGTEEFRQAWEEQVNLDACSYMEAYFYDLWALEVYQHKGGPVVTAVVGPQLALRVWLRPASKPIPFEGDTAFLANSPEWCYPIAFTDLPDDAQGKIARALEED